MLCWSNMTRWWLLAVVCSLGCDIRAFDEPSFEESRRQCKKRPLTACEDDHYDCEPISLSPVDFEHSCVAAERVVACSAWTPCPYVGLAGDADGGLWRGIGSCDVDGYTHVRPDAGAREEAAMKFGSCDAGL